MGQYQTIKTQVGLGLEAGAETGGPAIKLVSMSVGDGGGKAVQPSARQNGLVHEVDRVNLNSLSQNANDATQWVAEAIFPADRGGYTVREVGLWTDGGVLFAVANFPDTYKPAPSEGTAGQLLISLNFRAQNSDNITLVVDGNLQLATRDWTQRLVDQERVRAEAAEGKLQLAGDYATNSSLQQEVTRAEGAEAALENDKVSRSGDTMIGALAIRYTNNWGFGRGGGEFDLKMLDGPERFYGQLYRGTGDQTQGILGVSDETGDRQWKLRSNGSVLSPGGGVLPEVLGLSGRVVTQCFRIQNPADIQYVPFPIAFNCADPVNQIFILLGYGYNSNGGRESSVTYLYKQRTTNQGFWLDRSSSGFGDAAFDAVAIGVM